MGRSPDGQKKQENPLQTPRPQTGAALCAGDADLANMTSEEMQRLALALRESEKRFRRMADQAPVMIWMSGVDKLCTWLNKPWADFTGRRVDEDLGEGWMEAIHPEDQGRCREIYTAAFDARQSLAIEYRMRRHDGQWRWVLDTGAPLYQENGAFVGYIGSCLDVTDRRRSEEALRQSESRLKAEAAALAALNDASSRLWHIQDLNEGLEEMLAATMQLLGADMGNIQILDSSRGLLTIVAQRGFGPEFLGRFREVSADDESARGPALRSGARIVIADVDADPRYAPLRAVARDAGYRAMQSTPLIDRAGHRLGMLSTHWRSPHRPGELDLRRLDLYARQAADFIEHCRTNQMLRAGEDRMRTILNTVADAIITIDRRGIIMSVNPATERMFGHPAGELLGRNVRMLMPTPHHVDHDHYIRRYLETGEARIIGLGRQVEGRRKDGTVFPLDLAVNEIEHLGLFTGSIRDISARKQAERELERHRKDLQAMASELMLTEERERRRLAQDLHDGLGQALFRARMKLGQLALDDPAIREFDAILGEIGRMVNTLTFELSPPVLHQLGLRPALEWLARDLKQRYDLSVHLDHDGEALPLDGRVVVVLFRGVRELLINVAKHAGTDAARMVVRRRQDRVQITVEDQGRGFDMAAQSRHVEAGHFGLFSIRERLDYVDGSFAIQSAPGAGVRVTLTAPLAIGKARGGTA